MAKIIVLSDAEIKKLLDEKSVVKSVEAAYRQKSEKKADIWQMVFYEFDPGHADMDIKSGCLNEEEIYGLKLVSWFGDNPKKGLPDLFGTTLIFDIKTGEPKALLNAGYITKMRTGAAGAIGAKYLARKDSEELLGIGMGGIAPYQIAATLMEMPGIKHVTLIDPLSPEKSIDQAAQIAETVHKLMADCGCEREIAIEGTADMENAVRNADIIITMTPSRKPMIRKEWVKPGTHFSCVGADMSGKQEIESSIFSEARVFVDDIEQAVHVGECELPIKEKMFSRDRIAGEIGNLIAGTVDGRTNEEEITIFDSTGIALQDLTVAALALRKAKEQNLGKEVEI